MWKILNVRFHHLLLSTRQPAGEILYFGEFSNDSKSRFDDSVPTKLIFTAWERSRALVGHAWVACERSHHLSRVFAVAEPLIRFTIKPKMSGNQKLQFNIVLHYM